MYIYFLRKYAMNICKILLFICMPMIFATFTFFDLSNLEIPSQTHDLYESVILLKFTLHRCSGLLLIAHTSATEWISWCVPLSTHLMALFSPWSPLNLPLLQCYNKSIDLQTSDCPFTQKSTLLIHFAIWSARSSFIL